MTKITVGLTLRLLFVPNWTLKMCPYGTYLLLRSLEYVLRGRNVLLRSLESLMCMYTAVRWTVAMSSSCTGVLKWVTFDECPCKWCKTLYPGVLKWVNLTNVTAYGAIPYVIWCPGVLKGVKSPDNCPVMCSIVPFLFQMVLKWVNLLHVMCHPPKGLERESNLCCGLGSWKEPILKVVSHGDFNAVNLKVVSHGDWKHYVIQCKGFKRS